jgi:hypothetical protein
MSFIRVKFKKVYPEGQQVIEIKIISWSSELLIPEKKFNIYIADRRLRNVLLAGSFEHMIKIPPGFNNDINGAIEYYVLTKYP